MLEAAQPEPFLVDAASRDWLERLSGGSRERDEAIAKLHALLLAAARFTLAKRAGWWPQAGREALDDLAVEAADDALVALLAHVADYRGESRFTTWAWKFAITQASVTLRRRAWMAREIPLEDGWWLSVPGDAEPQRRLEQRELLAALKGALELALTPHQRQVFVAIALNDVPADVLAERMSTTRGALYKTLHDARHRLRAHLAT